MANKIACVNATAYLPAFGGILTTIPGVKRKKRNAIKRQQIQLFIFLKKDLVLLLYFYFYFLTKIFKSSNAKIVLCNCVMVAKTVGSGADTFILRDF